jgi:hypothetical protein
MSYITILRYLSNHFSAYVSSSFLQCSHFSQASEGGSPSGGIGSIKSSCSRSAIGITPPRTKPHADEITEKKTDRVLRNLNNAHKLRFP